MSLKAVHLAFIMFSTALSVLFGTWLLQRYAAVHEMMFLVGGIASLVATLGLVYYATRFLRIFRNVRYF